MEYQEELILYWSCVERVEEEQKLGAGNNPRKVLSFKSVDSTAKINALRHQGSESRDHCKKIQQ